MTVLEVNDHLTLLIEALWDARSQWKVIGHILGLKDGDICAIHEPDDGDCLTKVLSLWMYDGQATITDLLKALKSKVVNRSDIVREILRGQHLEKLGLHEEQAAKGSICV